MGENSGRHEGQVSRGRMRRDYDGLTQLVVGPGRNPDSRTQYRINVGDPDRTLAIEDDLLVLTDPDGGVLMMKQKGEYRCVITQQLQAVFAADRFVKAA